MTTLKTAGADCPKCGEFFPAEYAMAGKTPQWKCGTCGAGGELTGKFEGRPQSAAPASAPTVKKHWSARCST